MIELDGRPSYPACTMLDMCPELQHRVEPVPQPRGGQASSGRRAGALTMAIARLSYQAHQVCYWCARPLPRLTRPPIYQPHQYGIKTSFRMTSEELDTQHQWSPPRQASLFQPRTWTREPITGGMTLKCEDLGGAACLGTTSATSQHLHHFEPLEEQRLTNI
jgi:hypothetical protein